MIGISRVRVSLELYHGCAKPKVHCSDRSFIKRATLKMKVAGVFFGFFYETLNSEIPLSQQALA